MRRFIDWLVGLLIHVPAKRRPPAKGASLAWGKKVDAAFRAKGIEVAKSLTMDPDHLMAVIAFETAGTFRPNIKNFAGSGATGLIQFMPKTAVGLGTTVTQLGKMSAVEQLDWVYKYFKPYQGRMKTLSDVYMAVLYPRAVGKPDSYVLFQEGTTAYRQNAGLDVDRNGQVTKFEAASMVYQMLETGRLPANRWDA